MANMNSQRKYKTIRELSGSQNHNCAYCGVKTLIQGLDIPKIGWKKRTPKNLATIDHVIPISNGGKNNKKNLVMSCFGCNIKRSSMEAFEYYDKLSKST